MTEIKQTIDEAYALGEQSGRGKVIAEIFKYVTDHPNCTGLEILKLLNGKIK